MASYADSPSLITGFKAKERFRKLVGNVSLGYVLLQTNTVYN